MQRLLRKMRGAVFDGTDKIKWEHHQNKNEATTAKKHENNKYFPTVAYKSNYMCAKILINGFEPFSTNFCHLFKMDTSQLANICSSKK